MLLIAGVCLAARFCPPCTMQRSSPIQSVESYGALMLVVAVTVMEVALIVTLMVSGGSATATLARDTVFAAVMITCNGVVGISLLLGALRQHVASSEGTATALATVLAFAALGLVLPTFTTSRPCPDRRQRCFARRHG
jgi:Ca2+:H+ antiporter